MFNFTEVYSRIGKVDLKPLKNCKETLNHRNYKRELVEIKQVSVSAKEIAIIAGGSAAVGATAVAGAMGLATLVGTASTGTAIGALSGAAATNATLAWLGGGAVSAGGAGVVGGTVVLAGIAVAPLAIFGMFLGTNNGKKKLNEAHNYSDEVDVLVERVKTLVAELVQIRKGADLYSASILTLNSVLMSKIEEMGEIVKRLDERKFVDKYVIDPFKRVFNIGILTEEESDVIWDAANTASLLKELLEKPLLDGEGAFLAEAMDYVNDSQDKIEDYSKDVDIDSYQLEEVYA